MPHARLTSRNSENFPRLQISFHVFRHFSRRIDSKLTHVECLVSEGLILPSGEINWNCPCLGGMASGPCGSQFKEAFLCFHYSKEEVKGSECIEQFRSMQECMQRYPDLYPQEEDKENSSQAESGSAAADGSGLLSESDSAIEVSPDSMLPTDSQTPS
ncbi:hypothetical protein XENOCAPTIV_019916 [Xenoophorus captivus]|uniref:CHCH domain-containing protein n=1 Tax=Xenoophorus captivus TaxID=1517983 RepID=A0ABV0R463_9TELE